MALPDLLGANTVVTKMAKTEKEIREYRRRDTGNSARRWRKKKQRKQIIITYVIIVHRKEGLLRGHSTGTSSSFSIEELLWEKRFSF